MRYSYWVGVCPNAKREVFRFPAGSHPTPYCPTASNQVAYVCVIGPHKTRRGAEFMASPAARNNPHAQTANDADRIARTL